MSGEFSNHLTICKCITSNFPCRKISWLRILSKIFCIIIVEENSVRKMHITAALSVIRRKLFKGDMFRGKYRYVKPVKIRDMIMLEEEYKRDDRVMKLLLNPYLSVVCVQCRMFISFHFSIQFQTNFIL